MKFKSLFYLILFIMLATAAAAVTGNDLVEFAADYDGKIVEFQGEVVGDIMERGDYAWLNVHDGSRAIGIWTNKDLIRQLHHTGNYNYIGDKIKIKGVFNRACPAHGGDLDIHAQEISLIEAGHKVEHPINQTKLIAAGALLILTLGTYLFFLFLNNFKK